MRKELVPNFIIALVFSALAFVVKAYGDILPNFNNLILAVICIMGAVFAFAASGFTTVNYYAPNGISEAHAAKFGKILSSVIALALLAAVAYQPVIDIYAQILNNDGTSLFTLNNISNGVAVLSVLIYFILVVGGTRNSPRSKGDNAFVKLLVLLLTVAPCYHLITAYRINSSVADTGSFAWDILALAALAARWVYLLSCCAGKRYASVRKIIFFTTLSTIISAIATVGIVSDYNKAFFLYSWISGLMTLLLFLKNMNELDIYQPEPEVVESPATRLEFYTPSLEVADELDTVPDFDIVQEEEYEPIIIDEPDDTEFSEQTEMNIDSEKENEQAED